MSHNVCYRNYSQIWPNGHLPLTIICVMWPLCFCPSAAHSLLKQSVLNGHLSYTATNFWPMGDRLRQIWRYVIYFTRRFLWRTAFHERSASRMASNRTGLNNYCWNVIPSWTDLSSLLVSSLPNTTQWQATLQKTPLGQAKSVPNFEFSSIALWTAVWDQKRCPYFTRCLHLAGLLFTGFTVPNYANRKCYSSVIKITISSFFFFCVCKHKSCFLCFFLDPINKNLS
jgi:hypothetical protein